MRFIDPLHDHWHAAPASDTPTVPTEHSVLTLAQWQAARESWPRAVQAIGVTVPNDQDIEALQPDLHRLQLVALQFPKWTDGRAYSQARLLRTRLGFQGEIRATGEVLVDMLPLLQRTGFNAVQLHEGQRLESAQRALRFFAQHYQGDAVDPSPAFAREVSLQG